VDLLRYYSPSEIEEEYGIDANRIRTALRNMPNLIEGLIKNVKKNGIAQHNYFVPENEIFKLEFIKKNKCLAKKP
jgi:hypothetical protein